MVGLMYMYSMVQKKYSMGSRAKDIKVLAKQKKLNTIVKKNISCVRSIVSKKNLKKNRRLTFLLYGVKSYLLF